MDDNPITTEPCPAPKCYSGPSTDINELEKVSQEQDLARETLRQKLGFVDVAVDLIREARDE